MATGGSHGNGRFAWQRAVRVAPRRRAVDTALSRPFQAGVTAEHLFTREQSVETLPRVIGALTPART